MQLKRIAFDLDHFICDSKFDTYPNLFYFFYLFIFDSIIYCNGNVFYSLSVHMVESVTTFLVYQVCQLIHTSQVHTFVQCKG